MPISASFIANQGLLNIFGDGLANTVTVSRNAAGSILANGGAVPVAGGTPTIVNTTLIQVNGSGGNDTLRLNETTGALPASRLFGGSGNDAISGGSGADQLLGQSGNDVLSGRGGNDLLLGGDGNDTLTGGDGNDQMFGGAGDDRMIWNSGDDNDVMEGGSGIDTAEVNGGSSSEQFTLTANGTRVRLDRLDPAPFNLDIGTTEALVLKTGGGNDFFSATGNLAALIQLTVDGGAGNDTILGSNGADKLFGGTGNDFIDGQQGNDVAFLGAGNDVFQWDPGDGNDVVEGEDGTDTMLFNGSNIGENFDISANGERLAFSRNIANIVMDLNDVETIQLNALGGTDNIVVNDLSGTDAKLVAIDLAVIGGADDLAVDTVTVNGTNDDDFVTVTSLGGQIAVDGLSAQVTIDHAEASDKLVIDGAAGDDIIDAGGFAAGEATLQLLGGAGDDFIIGSAGDDLINGKAGDDVLFGQAGNDRFAYSSVLDGHDVIADFDGDATDGQDAIDLDALFDGLGVADADRAGRVQISDSGGGTVTLAINADGDSANGFELLAMTLNTVDAITVGEDVILSA